MFENPVDSNKKSKKEKKSDSESQINSLIDKNYPEDDYRRWIKLVESEEEYTYKHYLENLGLSEDELKGKRIADLGAGNREFAGHCMFHNITEEIYSLDCNLRETPGIIEAQKVHWGKDITRKINEKTVAGNMEELPFKEESFDIVLVHCATPSFMDRFDYPEQLEKNMHKAFWEIIRIISPGGEVRMFPLPNEKIKHDKKWSKVLDRIISVIAKDEKYQVWFENVEKKGKENEQKEKRLIIRKR